MPQTLTATERAVLLVLMAECRPMTNAELRAGAGVVLEGGSRRRLNALGLVESVRAGRSFVHELTDDGWARCAAEPAAGPWPRGGSSTGALQAVLQGVLRYLERCDLRLSDVFRPDPGTRIRQAYRELAPAPGRWVGLATLRERLADLPRGEVDGALVGMLGSPGVSLVPESNRKTLSGHDRAAAVHVGGEDLHLLAIHPVQEPPPRALRSGGEAAVRTTGELR